VNLKKILKKWRAKHQTEALLRSGFWSVSLGAFCVFFVSLFYHLIAIKPSPVLYAGVFFGVSFLAFWIGYFAFFRYTLKETVTRVDNTGLEERIGTMYQYQNETTPAALLQREDALACLKNASPKKLRLRIFKKDIFACIFSLLFSVSLLFLPYDIFVVESQAGDPTVPLTPPTETNSVLADLLKALRQTINDSPHGGNYKTELYRVVNELEADLKDSFQVLEQVADIHRAEEKYATMKAEKESAAVLGLELQKFPLTVPLGKAVVKGDAEAIKETLAELKNQCIAAESKKIELTEAFYLALARASEVPDRDLLKRALDDLYEWLDHTDRNHPTRRQEITDAFEEAETAILSALAKQTSEVKTLNDLLALLGEAKRKLLGEEQDKLPSSPSEGEEENTPPTEEQPPQNPENPEEGEGEGEGGNKGEGETVYDPAYGEVPYDQIINIYYADYLKALQEGRVPPDLEAFIEAYYKALIP